VARRGRDFALGDGRVLGRLVRVLGADLARREEERLQRVLDRIQSKVVFELRPRDLAYQIFDALHQLVHYDHSAALLVYEEEAGAFRVEAEKVVWTKAKSAFIGHEIPVAPALVAALGDEPEVRLLPAAGAPAGDEGSDLLLPLARYHQGRGIPDATSALFAPLFHAGELLGVLKVAAHRRPPFDSQEVGVVRRFLPVARLSLRNARLRSSLEAQALEAEVRAGLVTLARAVAHDVNGAVGAILLLAEQLRAEVEQGEVEAGRLAQDLDDIVAKARQCKRIFGNMLRLASVRAGSGPVDLNQVIRDLMPMLEAQVGARPIHLLARLTEPLAAVEASRPHLEHIVWNLVTNAVEAMADRPGSVELATREAAADRVALSVTDDGPGIEPELIEKVQEPFFSTKPGGTGLGLAICRSLAWQYGGSLALSSSAGGGTRVEVQLPLAGRRGEGRK
jgi:signal transduction histidine kinase